ncbi:ATP-dependent bile acid permease [Venturia inaequalis]|nr:ATP-dependent bile acid permease [Venturia inaequalis]
MLKEDGNLDIRVNDRYQLQQKLGSGSFGVVYEAIDLITKRNVAIKLEYAESGSRQLEIEADIYKELSGRPGIPEVYWFGHDCEFRALVFELLGPNLQDLLNYCRGRFSLKTVLMLADQLIPRLRQIHHKYVHRDIKPENILTGEGKKGNEFFIVDIGLAEEYGVRSWRGNDLPGNGRVVGTVRYASIRAHAGKELTPRDDLESLGYVLVYLLRGSLPWQGLKAQQGEDIDEIVGLKKRETTTKELCEGLPKAFELYFEHLSRRQPDHTYLRRLFRNLFVREGFEYDNVFDWTELMFFEQLNDEKSKSSDGKPVIQSQGQ